MPYEEIEEGINPPLNCNQCDIIVCTDCVNKNKIIYCAKDNLCDSCGYENDFKVVRGGRKCKICEPEHEFHDRYYRCENCNRDGCANTMLDDEWKNRCRDNVFMCRACYRSYQRLMDCM